MKNLRASTRTERNSFIEKHQDIIAGVLSCFDRIIFKGYLMSLSYPEGVTMFLARQGVLLKDWKQFVKARSEEMKEHAKSMAKEQGRLFLPLKGRKASKDKDDRARRIAKREGITEGLICVLSVVEQCQSFKLQYGEGRPRLVSDSPRCLCLYYYFMDPVFGLIHVRVQTWFPFVVQVYTNGHEWLAREMTRAGIGYEQADNTFVRIDDFGAAQELADRLGPQGRVRHLNRLARLVNPLMGGLLKGLRYYWVTDQCEYATDVVFDSPADLKSLYEKLLPHAIVSFGAEDVMTFLGRKLHGNFQGEIKTTLNRREPGARIKHRMKGNWIKMYNKHGRVLRIETVINHPYEFKVWRRGKRKGEVVMGYLPMAKRVSNLPHYAEKSLSSNLRYLEALTAVENPSRAYELLDKLCHPVTQNGNRLRALNPLRREELAMFAVAMRGEYCLRGFRNDDLRKGLGLERPADAAGRKRVSSRVGRLIRLLRGHGLLKRIPRTRSYRPTLRGLTMMAAALSLYNFDLLAQVQQRL